MKSKHGFETTVERSALMKKIKGFNTKPEIILRKRLWFLGYRYRIHLTTLPGKPDIVLTTRKIAIFIDGEFWHGYKWEEKKVKIKANREYWIKKIEGNIRRDIEQTIKLQSLGYSVIRFWEMQIRKDLNNCIEEILILINGNI